MPFGIPEIDAAFTELDKSVNAGAGDLTQIAMAAINALDAASQQSARDTGKLKALKERIFNKIDKASKNDLQTVADGAAQALAVAGEASAADLGALSIVPGARLQDRFIHPVQPFQPPPGQQQPPQPPPIPAPAPPPILPPVPPIRVEFGPPPVEQPPPIQPPPQPLQPLPDGSQGVYWCLEWTNKADGPNEVVFATVDSLGPLYQVGPRRTALAFQDQQSALDYCNAGGVSLPPPILPAPPPPAPPPILGDQWWCAHLPDFPDTHAVFKGDLGTWVPDGGPFDTRDEADALCASFPPPVKKTPPSPSTCVGHELPAPPHCDSIPIPGSVEWCANQEKITAVISSIGRLILDTIDSVMDPNNLGDDVVVGQQPESLLDVGPWINWIWRNVKYTLQCMGKVVLSSIQSAFRWIRSIATCLLPCDPDTMIGLWALKSFLKVFQRLRLGTDAAVWITADIIFTFDQMEAALQYIINALCPVHIPGIEQTLESYLKGTIPEDIARCRVAMHGGDWDIWYSVVFARRERLQTKDLIQYWKRLDLPEDALRKELESLGFLSNGDIDRQLEMYWEIPTINDHLSWLRRNVDDLEYVQKYNLLDGFSTDEIIRTIPGFQTYTTHTDTHGRDFWKVYGHDLTTRGMRIQYAANHYAAHWIQASPEQMRQFVFRLRPGRVPDNITFTVDDFKRILAEQDYAPIAREWFAATINPVPAISYIKQMFQLGVINADTLKSYHMDLGYKSSDADNFVGVDRVQRARHLASSGHGFTPAAMANAYAIGEMQEDEIRKRMDEQGYPQEIATDLLRRAKIDLQRIIVTRARSRSLTHLLSQVKNALSVGVMSVPQAVEALVSAGWPNEYAVGLAQLEVASANTALVKEAIAKLKRAFLAGEIDAQYVGQSMLLLGITHEAASRYGVAWQLMNTPGRKRRTAAQITNDVANNAISTEEALVRLQNLGYTDADQRLFMEDARRKISSMQQKAHAADLKAGRQRAADLAKQIRQADTIRRRLLSDLKRQEPVPHLQRWLASGAITRDYFDRRMTLYGYTPGEIQAYAEEKLPPKNGKGTGSAGQPKSP